MKFSLRNRHATMLFKNSDFVVTSHESPQSMIQSAEDFLILPMKKPCNQGKSGTQGVRISSGVPLFSFCGVNTPSGKICNLHPPPVPREGKLKGWGNR